MVLSVLKGQESKCSVGQAWQAFVVEILIYQSLLFGADIVVDGILRRGRADGILERESHHHFGADAWGQVVDIDVAEGFKKLGPVRGEGIEVAEMGF